MNDLKKEIWEIIMSWVKSGIEITIAMLLAFAILSWLFDFPAELIFNLIIAVILIQSSIGIAKGITAFIFAIGKIFKNAFNESKAE